MPVTLADAAPFLRHIADDFDDDTPRLVYADFLDEHDEPARAEFVRLQCQLERLPPADSGRDRLKRRARDLLTAHETAWLGCSPAALADWHFRRGFVSEFTPAEHATPDDVAGLIDRHPATVAHVNPEGLRFVARRHPTLAARLGGVRLRVGHSFEEDVPALLTGRHADGWRSLAVDGPFSIPPPSARAGNLGEADGLFEAGVLPSLRELSLLPWGLKAESRARMLSPEHAGRWTALAWDSYEGDVTGELLAELSLCERLERLTLTGQRRPLLDWPCLPLLTELRLAGSGETLRALAAWAGLPRLRKLRLAVPLRGGDDLHALSDVLAVAGKRAVGVQFTDADPVLLPWLPYLSRLSGVGFRRTPRDAAVRFLRSPDLDGLRSLDWEAGELSADDLWDVLTGPAGRRLRRLNLDRCRLGREALDLLADWPGLDDLDALSLRACEFADGPPPLDRLRERLGRRLRA